MTGSDKRGVIAVSTVAAVALAATVWTATMVPIPRGYIIGCAVSSPILAWLASWRPRITTPIAVGIASLTVIVLRGEFYGRGLGLLSLRSLQSLAIWTLIFAAAVLVRVAVMRRQPS